MLLYWCQCIVLYCATVFILIICPTPHCIYQLCCQKSRRKTKNSKPVRWGSDFLFVCCIKKVCCSALDPSQGCSSVLECYDKEGFETSPCVKFHYQFLQTCEHKCRWWIVRHDRWSLMSLQNMFILKLAETGRWYSCEAVFMNCLHLCVMADSLVLLVTHVTKTQKYICLKNVHLSHRKTSLAVWRAVINSLASSAVDCLRVLQGLSFFLLKGKRKSGVLTRILVNYIGQYLKIRSLSPLKLLHGNQFVSV